MSARRAASGFVLVNFAVQWAAFAVAAPLRLRVVRAHGAAPAEYLTYLWYLAGLLAGVAGLILGGFVVVSARLGEPIARGAIVVVETVLWLAILIEVLSFTILGVQPYGVTIWEQIGTADLWNLPWWSFAGLFGVVGVLAVAEWSLLRVLVRAAASLPGAWLEHGVAPRLLVYAAIMLATFVAVDRPDAERLVPRGALPLYSLWRVPARRFPELRPLRMIGDSLQAPVMARRPDIVFLMAESLRWDMLRPEIMPNLSRFATAHGCLMPPRHYAGGHLTQYGTFSLLYGLGAWAFLPYMQQSRPSWPLAVLRHNGYQLYGFDATGVLSYDINPLEPDQFDGYATRLGQDSLAMVETARDLRDFRGRAPRFVFTFLYGTHAAYTSPSDFEPGWPPERLIGSHPLGWVRYLRSVRYADHLMAPLLHQLGARLDAGDAALMVTGDHGEEFWEFGLGGHASVRFQDVRTRVPLLLCLPGATTPIASFSEHADIFPTIFAWAGAAPAPADAMSGRSLFERPDSIPVVLAGSGFPERAGEFAIVTSGAKFWLTLRDPQLEDIQLDRATDLDDQAIAVSPGLRDTLRTALERFRRTLHGVLRAN